MKKDVYDLTNPQKSIWLTEQFYKNSSISNICGTVTVLDKTNFEALKKAINEFIKLNDSFRIKFTYITGTPRQHISDYVPFDIKMYNVNNENDVKKMEYKYSHKVFQTLDSLLYDFRIFRFPDGHGGFVVNLHHLISDAWTAGLLVTQIMDLYTAIINKEELPFTEKPSYTTYIDKEKQYLESNKFKKDEEFWLGQFSSIPELATIPSASHDNFCKTNDSTAERKQYVLSKELIDTINRLCKKYHVSIFNFFMAILAIYISNVCNLDEFVIGTPILNRSTFQEKQTTGMFISTVPFKIDLTNKNLSFCEFLSHIGTETLSMFRHQKYPYQYLLNHLRKENKTIPNLYDILLSYQNIKSDKQTNRTNYESHWIFNGNVSDSINIHLYDMNDLGSLDIAYDYQVSNYKESDIEALHRRILWLIEQVIKNDSILLQNIDIITPEEKDRIFDNYNHTTLDYDSSKTIPTLFEEQVQKTPEKTALIFEGKEYTYQYLNEQANKLAHKLISLHVESGDIIGIMTKRSPEMIIGLLAILKTGSSYLPIDPEYPEERIQYMLENSNCNILLVNELSHSEGAPNLNKININLNSDFYISESAENLNFPISADRLMYLIYTSGSTGLPKGVMLTHKNIHNFIVGMKEKIDFDENKIIVSLTTICFDIFVLESWLPLTSGLTVVLANETEQNNQEALNTLCLEHHVNMIQTTPSRYSILLKNKNQLDYLANITDILVGGEPLPQTLLDSFKQLSKANIYNVYGPTETAVWSTVKDVTNENQITIGSPIANTSCYIVNNNLHLLPPYTPGKLYIGGDGVSKGYYKREELTKEKFMPSPFKNNETIYDTGDLAYYKENGDLVHQGRSDFQVKIRGYRIELSEIESKILQLEEIKECVVIDKNGKYLICFYVAQEEVEEDKIVSYLLKFMPNYMVPSVFKRLDYLPLTANGKINRKELPDVSIKKINVEIWSTEIEKIISQEIEHLLSIDSVDINTPFMTLGLDSLGIMQVQTLLLKYNLNITTQDFYKYPTIKKLAERIEINLDNYKEQDYSMPEAFKHQPNEILSFLKMKEESILGNVFLSGANGFIGVHVLHELLTTTNSNVYCLVRGKNHEHSVHRLLDIYEFYFHVNLTPLLDKRVFVISGDVIYENFNISSDLLNTIAQNVSTIIHTAAIVKHYGDFGLFERVNVGGTKHMVEFAYQNQKRFIHLSSISVSGNYLVKQDNRNVEFSENDLYIGQHYTQNVYVNSKFEAENLVYSYMKKGLIGKVLRLGIVAGRYSDGVFQKNISENAFYARIKSIILLSRVSSDMIHQHIEFTPIDECAKAIVLLAKTPIADNKVFHLYNHNLATIGQIIRLLKNFNINIETIGVKEFEKYILSLSDEGSNRILNGIINDFNFHNDNTLEINYDFSVKIESFYTQKYLHLLGFEWSKVDDTYIMKLLDYMRHVNFI